jgi:serine/threonine protein kinase
MIGGGRFGVLQLVRELGTGKEYALTQINVKQVDTGLEQRFHREIEILGHFHHPTLLGLSGYVPLIAGSRTCPAILTEYMWHGTLQDAVNLEGAGDPLEMWNATRKLIVLYGIAVAISVLHAEWVIHRDLKPENVLLDDAFEPRVADFGVSKVNSPDGVMKQRQGIGTPRFVAPEIHDGQEYSFPVDVYSYGMTMYVVITGLVPFAKVNVQYIIGTKVMNGERPVMPSTIQQHWRALIEACWAQNPEQRRTVPEIQHALSGADFLEDTIDADAFAKYRAKIERAGGRLEPGACASRGRPGRCGRPSCADQETAFVLQSF